MIIDYCTKIVITGANSGLGFELVNKLLGGYVMIAGIDINCSRLQGNQYMLPIEADVSNEDQVKSACTLINGFFCGPPDIIINCAGVNYINWLDKTPVEEWDRVMNTNAKSIFLMAKAFAPFLEISKGTILNIVSNASHMPMTNSIAYNASKGAAHIMTLQLARELGPKGITVFGISPNKLSGTRMSEYIDNTVPKLRGWSTQYSKEYQLKSLPAGEETDPRVLADFIGFLLSNKTRHKYLAGCVIPYGA